MAEKRTKRREQAMNTRKKILEMASALFDAKGSQNVTIEDIAAAAGCSPGNIYNYFKNKEELSACMLQTLDLSYGAVAQELLNHLPCRDMTAEERLIHYFVQVQEICARDPQKLTYSYVYNLKFPDSELLRVRDDRELYRFYRQFIAQLLAEDGRYKGITEDALLRRLILLGRGILLDWLIEGREGNIGVQAEEVVRTYLRGVTMENRP